MLPANLAQLLFVNHEPFLSSKVRANHKIESEAGCHDPDIVVIDYSLKMYLYVDMHVSL